MDAVTTVPEPANEPVRTYAPGTAERASLQARLQELRAEHVELTQTIGGRRRMAAGERFAVVEPHRHASVLGTSANATDADVADAVAAAKAAAPAWAALPFDERAADFGGMVRQELLCISTVLHEAFIAVDEKGTEAAAATAVVMRTVSAPMLEHEVVVDRPFLFVVHDVAHLTPLFVGRVTDPTA